METTLGSYRVDRRQISFIKFILEAYDNVAVLSTVDSNLGLVQVCMAPGCEDLVDGILKGLSAKIEIVPTDRGATNGKGTLTNL